MTPRIAGTGLITLGVLAAIVAGFLFPQPAWSIAAAALLTASLIAMGVGLLWLYRRSWSDKTWPPGRNRTPNLPRGRKVLWLIGLGQLCLVPVGIAAWIYFSVAGAIRAWDGLAVGLCVVLSSVQGASLLVMARQFPVGKSPPGQVRPR